MSELKDENTNELKDKNTSEREDQNTSESKDQNTSEREDPKTSEIKDQSTSEREDPKTSEIKKTDKIKSYTRYVAIIAGFTYYISVAKDLEFKQRFKEMATISLSVAAFSFVIGLVVKEVLGIDI